MTKYRLLLIFTLISLALVGCSASKRELIVGRWKCKGLDENQVVSGDLEYVRNGKWNMVGQMVGEDAGTMLHFDVVSHGRWKIIDNELIETINELSVTGFRVDDVELPTEAFAQKIKNGLIGLSSGIEIIKLDEKVLITKQEDLQVSCTRK